MQILYKRLRKLKAKVLKSTCRTISVCKLLQIVNLDTLTFLQLWSCSTNQIIGTILTRILIGLLQRAAEHADDIVVRFENEVCFEN